LAADNDPLFLQIKEARASVLEPYAGKSAYPNHGQRVVVGQRMMQSATDMFLGWARAKAGFDVYVRQLRDMKMSAVVEGWDFETLRQNLCVGFSASTCANRRRSYDLRLHGREQHF
jgi:hypothetical protein